MRFAAGRFAASFIYSSVFKLTHKRGMGEEDPEDDIKGWLREGLYALKQYLKKVQVSKVISAPVYSTERPLLQGKGVAEHGIGIVIPTDNLVLERTEYDVSGLLDWNTIDGYDVETD